jgi:hypothetical protein
MTTIVKPKSEALYVVESEGRWSVGNIIGAIFIESFIGFFGFGPGYLFYLMLRSGNVEVGAAIALILLCIVFIPFFFIWPYMVIFYEPPRIYTNGYFKGGIVTPIHRIHGVVKIRPWGEVKKVSLEKLYKKHHEILRLVIKLNDGKVEKMSVDPGTIMETVKYFHKFAPGTPDSSLLRYCWIPESYEQSRPGANTPKKKKKRVKRHEETVMGEPT